jgi:hypothetical protein
MVSSTAGKGGRDIVAYFAGHLAHLLNGNDHLAETVTVAEVKPYRLFEQVRRLLLTNRHYRENLLGAWAYPPPNDAEDAADFYYESVLDRPIGRRPDTPSSADRLLAFVASRAAGPFERREIAVLSTWKAMTGGPSRIRRFAPGPELFELSNHILKCLDACNRPYAEVLRLGLCPREWLAGDAEVSVNSLKAANSFLKALRTSMNMEVGRRPSADELAAAWNAAPVPGHADAAAFAVSLLGGAILARVAGQDHVLVVAFDDTVSLGEAEVDEDEPLMGGDEALPMLDRAVMRGIITSGEKGVLAAVLDGAPLADAMRHDLGIRRRLKQEFDNDVAAYVADLSGRVADFVASEQTVSQ